MPLVPARTLPRIARICNALYMIAARYHHEGDPLTVCRGDYCSLRDWCEVWEV